MNVENNCPHHTCKKKKPYGHYACTNHWFQLSETIRHKIYLGYKQKGILSPIWQKADKEAREHWRLIERNDSKRKEVMKDKCPDCGLSKSTFADNYFIAKCSCYDLKEMEGEETYGA